MCGLSQAAWSPGDKTAAAQGARARSSATIEGATGTLCHPLERVEGNTDTPTHAHVRNRSGYTKVKYSRQALTALPYAEVSEHVRGRNKSGYTKGRVFLAHSGGPAVCRAQ